MAPTQTDSRKVAAVKQSTGESAKNKKNPDGRAARRRRAKRAKRLVSQQREHERQCEEEEEAQQAADATDPLAGARYYAAFAEAERLWLPAGATTTIERVRAYWRATEELKVAKTARPTVAPKPKGGYVSAAQKETELAESLKESNLAVLPELEEGEVLELP